VVLWILVEMSGCLSVSGALLEVGAQLCEKVTFLENKKRS
jgi:hypothetical protein